MIISCTSCNKKFEIDSNLIPEKGRLLSCGSCNHQWFFSNKITNNQKTTVAKDEVNSNTINFTEDTLEKDIKINNADKIEKESTNNSDVKNDVKTLKKKKNNVKILNLILVFIISFIALIIIVDTFQSLISIYIPNIEYILYNLYETLKDINLFFKDLF
jgi:predicted Zn finger-like uncharacterized protein